MRETARSPTRTAAKSSVSIGAAPEPSPALAADASLIVSRSPSRASPTPGNTDGTTVTLSRPPRTSVDVNCAHFEGSVRNQASLASTSEGAAYAATW